MKIVKQEVEVSPMSTKSRLLKEALKHLKGGIADDLKSKYSTPEVEVELEPKGDEMIEGAEQIGDLTKDHPDKLEMNGESNPNDEEELKKFIQSMDEDALSKLIGK